MTGWGNRWMMEGSTEMQFKPRPNEELQLIKEWYERTKRFEDLWSVDAPTPTEWQEFEEKLSPGTLRNFIRMLRTLTEIAQDENKGKRQEMFDEMLNWLNELHPLEKEGLTLRIRQIVNANGELFGNEIVVPARVEGRVEDVRLEMTDI